MNSEEAQRLKDLEIENARLKRAVADLTIDNMVAPVDRWLGQYNRRAPRWKAV